MSTKDTYQQIMIEAKQLALATETVAGHTPSVRIVNYLFDADKNTVYVCTASNAEKVAELAAHPTVSFTTAPESFGTVRVTGAKATLVNDLKPALMTQMDAKYADFKMFDAAARANMNAYALTYNDADVFFRGDNHIEF